MLRLWADFSRGSRDQSRMQCGGIISGPESYCFRCCSSRKIVALSPSGHNFAFFSHLAPRSRPVPRPYRRNMIQQLQTAGDVQRLRRGRVGSGRVPVGIPIRHTTVLRSGPLKFVRGNMSTAALVPGKRGRGRRGGHSRGHGHQK